MDVRIECNLEAYDKTYDCYHFRLAIAFSAAVARFIRRPKDAVSIIYHRARLNHSPPPRVRVTGNEKRPFVSGILQVLRRVSYRTVRISCIRVLINGCLNYCEGGKEEGNSRARFHANATRFLRAARVTPVGPLFPPCRAASRRQRNKREVSIWRGKIKSAGRGRKLRAGGRSERSKNRKVSYL